MTDKLRRTLQENAPQPKHRLDVDAVMQEGRRRKQRRIAAYSSAAVCMLLLGGVIAAKTMRTQVVPDPVKPAVSPSPASSARPPSDAFEKLSAGWHELPLPPEARSSGPAFAWTGREVLVWGGYQYTGYDDESSEDTGFLYDPEAETWRAMADAPLPARSNAATAWTGSEFLIWGGWTESGGTFSDGAAYDPVRDTWRKLPDAPLSERAPLSAWTGTELIVWGTSIRADEPPRDGAAYNPETNTWRKISDGPIELTDATAVWTGDEMIVFGAALLGGNHAETDNAIAAAYEPSSDRWRRLPDSGLSPQASTAAWNGREMIAWDYGNESAAFDPNTDTWRALTDVPIDPGECSPSSVAIQGDVFGDYCGTMTVFDSSEDAWRILPGRDFGAWGFAIAAADPVVLLVGSYVETGEEAMLAYRDPTWGKQAADQDAERCGAPPVRPTYLPWLAEGDRVPDPRNSYDEEVDRFQQGWDDPRFGPGEAGVGLTIYPLPNRDGNAGRATGIFVQGAEGRLHFGEGGSVSMSWDLDQRCNFLELSIANPDLNEDELAQELLRTARGLVEAGSDSRCKYSSLRPTYLPWVIRDEKIQTPDRTRSEDGRAALLNWHRSEEFPPVYASLSVATTPTAPAGQPTGIFQQGVEGDLDVHSGGDMSINWSQDSGACNLLRLVLVMPDDTPAAQVQREIKKIAKSLEEGP